MRKHFQQREEVKEEIIDLLDSIPSQERKRLLEDVIRSLAYRYQDESFLEFFPKISEKNSFFDEAVLLDYSTVAEMFDVSVKTIQRLVKKGRLTAVNPGKKGVKITAGSVRALVKRGLIPIEALLE